MKAVTRREWHQHVKATPIGMVPCLPNGIPAYQIAWRTRFTGKRLLDYFIDAAPARFWPKWMQGVAR